MTNEEALALFKNHEYMTDFSWQDEMSEIAISAIEKQIPKKPRPYIAFDGIKRNGCPKCSMNEILYAGQKYCSVCGQRIDCGRRYSVMNDEIARLVKEHDERIRADERAKVRNALYERARENGVYMSEYIAFIDCAFEQMKGGRADAKKEAEPNRPLYWNVLGELVCIE